MSVLKAGRVLVCNVYACIYLLDIQNFVFLHGLYITFIRQINIGADFSCAFFSRDF